MNTKQEAGNEKVTIYDIARQAGVSTTTVHKALHGQKGVSDAKRQGIPPHKTLPEKNCALVL